MLIVSSDTDGRKLRKGQVSILYLYGLICGLGEKTHLKCIEIVDLTVLSKLFFYVFVTDTFFKFTY